MLHTKVAGAWRQIYTPQVKVSGTWRRVKAIWIKVGADWKQVYEECPAYFSVPNLGSSPTSRGYGTIFSDFGSPTMHNRVVNIPAIYKGYSLVGWSASMGFTMFNMDTASSSVANVTSGISFTNPDGTNRAVNYDWPAFGSNIGTYDGKPLIFQSYYGRFTGWYRWSYEECSGSGEDITCWLAGYYQNYFSTTVSQSFTALPITGNTLTIRAYAVSHARDWGLACQWSNFKLTLQNPHTGATVALAFA